MTGIGIIDFAIAVLLGSVVVITIGMLFILAINVYEYLRDDENE